MPNARTVTSARPGSGCARPHKSSASETLAITTASVCLITFVETDRCAADAVAVVTGCRLGKRALKFRDWGKVATGCRESISARLFGAEIKIAIGLADGDVNSATRKTQCAFASTPTCACASARGRRTIAGCDVVVCTVWRESW